MKDLPVRLSPRTEQLIAALFPSDARLQAADLLLNHCGSNLPFCEKRDEFQLERIRFAALKLSDGDTAKLRDAIQLAQQDWRDLLVAADFANDPEAHTRWSPRND